MDGLRKTMISDGHDTDTSVTTWANLLSGYRLLFGDSSLSVSMVCLLKMNLMFSLVTGYKIMDYLRYHLGLYYLKYSKQVVCVCWDCVVSAVPRNFALLWTFHLQELNMNTSVFFYVLSPLPLISYCFSLTGNIGYSVAQN